MVWGSGRRVYMCPSTTFSGIVGQGTASAWKWRTSTKPPVGPVVRRPIWERVPSLLSSGCSNAVRWLYVHGPEPETDNNNKFFLSFAQSHRVTFEKKQAKLNITAVQKRLQLFCNAHGTHITLQIDKDFAAAPWAVCTGVSNAPVLLRARPWFVNTTKARFTTVNHALLTIFNTSDQI